MPPLNRGGQLDFVEACARPPHGQQQRRGESGHPQIEVALKVGWQLNSSIVAEVGVQAFERILLLEFFDAPVLKETPCDTSERAASPLCSGRSRCSCWSRTSCSQVRVTSAILAIGAGCLRRCLLSANRHGSKELLNVWLGGKGVAIAVDEGQADKRMKIELFEPFVT